MGGDDDDDEEEEEEDEDGDEDEDEDDENGQRWHLFWSGQAAEDPTQGGGVLHFTSGGTPCCDAHPWHGLRWVDTAMSGVQLKHILCIH